MSGKASFCAFLCGAAIALLCGNGGAAAADDGASGPPFRDPAFPWQLEDLGAAPLKLASATTPRAALERFAQSYHDLDLEAYAALLTADYRFVTADPRFDEAYPDGFDRTQDVASTAGLFNLTPVPGKPAITSIDAMLGEVAEGADPEHPDSLGHYRLIVAPRMHMVVHAGEAEMRLERSLLAFYMVRGDAAALFDPAPADAEHWYLRRWVETPDAAEAGGDGAVEPAMALTRNPAAGPFEIDLSLPAAGLYDIELFDVAGRRIGRRLPVRFPAGASHHRLDDTARLPAGIYWIRLSQGGRSLLTRVATRL